MIQKYITDHREISSHDSYTKYFDEKNSSE